MSAIQRRGPPPSSFTPKRAVPSAASASLASRMCFGAITMRPASSPGGTTACWAFRRTRACASTMSLPLQPLALRSVSATIDRDERKGEQPSDHAPVIIDFADGDQAKLP